MEYRIQHIAALLNAETKISEDLPVEHLLIDSRKIIFPNSSIFFALQSNRRDGHAFIQDVYEKGVRNFVVQKGFDGAAYSRANFLMVEDVLKALQLLAAQHRSNFIIPVIGITGSNGKTIVKEWLYQLLNKQYNIVRSPRSYNSQIGVPLSVWPMNNNHTLGIFEAGISTVGEMEKLQKMIQPTIGVFTGLGNAHNEGFANLSEKLIEKWKLFSTVEHLVCKEEMVLQVQQAMHDSNIRAKCTTWSKTEKSADLLVVETKKHTTGVTVQLLYHQTEAYTITIPFTDEASIENALTCCCVMHVLNFPATAISNAIPSLTPVEMRMQLKKGMNDCTIINDSYSNDLSSLSIALDFLKQQAGNQSTTVILSDIPESGLPNEVLYKQVAAELKHRSIHRLIGIGNIIEQYRHLLVASVPQTIFYSDTKQFLSSAQTHLFAHECILLKGARKFSFETISNWLEQKVHQTVLEVNLTAMVHNLKQYQQQLLPTTKLMVMVKAFSYGSGSVEIARLLQFHKVDYLAVAYADEGVELRRAGISLPIMVMNPDASSFEALVEHYLEPEIYSFPICQSFHQYLQQQGIQQFPVHIKLNTGMNRLGFDIEEIPQLGEWLGKQQTILVKSVFSHLVGSETSIHDAFTQQQSQQFELACSQLEKNLGYGFLKHLANTAAIFRHPHLQYDMVRLGIGLYGVDSAAEQIIQLETVATLKSTIAQIRKVKAGSSIGYNRKSIVQQDSIIATIRIGYADGLSRRMSNGAGAVFIKGQLAKIIGNVCMDMIMADVTHIPHVQEEDIVEIFGKHLPVQQVAQWCDTIAYEIMTAVNQRVKRVYVEE